MLITIFTPTYNRAYILPKLYESLQRQTCKNFEWLIVDDGSNDNTEEIIKPWLTEQSFPVRYIKQKNGGKHRAVNLGVKEAEGTWFFIVDSDDQLTDDAIEIVSTETINYRDDKVFCGICGIKTYFNGVKVGGEASFSSIDCNSLDLRYKFGVKGDMAEVFKTEVLRQFPFPEIPGENFCPEDVVWQRIASEYKFHYFYKKIYLCDYQLDGLTSKITTIRMQCPVASTICYSELVSAAVPLKQKIKASINYWRFWLCKSDNQKPMIDLKWFWTFPMGVIMHFNDLRKLK